jgi:PKD repeat protein
MQKTQVSRAGFALPLSHPSALSLVWILGLTLLLFATNTYAGQVSLAWDPSSSSNLAGYRLYYGQASQTYTSHIDVGLQTSYTITGLTDGQTYYFAATAYDLAGIESTFSNEVSTTLPTSTTAPVAAFSGNPTSGQAPLTVAFTDTSTGSITAWAWNFGDGTRGSSLQFPTYTYSIAGTYTVQLTVTGPGGSNTATQTGYITVTAPPPPVAAFSATPTTGLAPLPVQFTDASTGSISTWSWNFGDGTTSTVQNPPHIYSTAGIYTVNLTVTGPGGSATKAAAITVTAPPPPVATFSATPTTGHAPLLVIFTDASTGSVSTWSWNFGDGTTSSAQNPQHIYSTPGIYTVSLTVNGPSGATTATKANAITVQTNPAGLVAAYSCDEGSGTTLTDVSGYGNNGTLSGATWTTAGKFGGALSFNGSSNLVTVNDAASLDFTTGMTLEAWVYPTKTMTSSTVIMKEQPGDFVYVLYASANRHPGLFINVATSAVGEHGTVGSSSLPTYTWSHLAGTYDGTTLRLYINGTLVASQTFVGLIAPSTGAMRIGGDRIWGDYFRGRIDEIRLYKRALSASDIQSDMSTPINVLDSVSIQHSLR